MKTYPKSIETNVLTLSNVVMSMQIQHTSDNLILGEVE